MQWFSEGTSAYRSLGKTNREHAPRKNNRRRQLNLAEVRSSTPSMARVYPFRALRYNPSLVRLQDVVTQPYDKITPAMQQAYYHRSPYNLVRIILGLPELFDVPGVNDVYTRAARDFADWRQTEFWPRRKIPASSPIRSASMCLEPRTKCVERRGFIALGELYDYSQNVIFRHEQTLSKPKSDRLNLLRATRAHFGQIFMLYSDPGLTAEKVLVFRRRRAGE